MRAKTYLKRLRCACTRPAVRFVGNDPVCEFCARIEARMKRYHKEAAGGKARAH